MSIYNHIDKLIEGDFYLNPDIGKNWSSSERILKLKELLKIIKLEEENIKDINKKEIVEKLKQLSEILLNHYIKNNPKNIDNITIQEINQKEQELILILQEINKNNENKTKQITKEEYERRKKILYEEYCESDNFTIEKIQPTLLNILINNWDSTQKIAEYTKTNSSTTFYQLAKYFSYILNKETIKYFVEISKYCEEQTSETIKNLNDYCREIFNQQTAKYFLEIAKFSEKDTTEAFSNLGYYCKDLLQEHPEYWDNLIMLMKKNKDHKLVLIHIIHAVKDNIKEIGWNNIINLNMEKILPVIELKIENNQIDGQTINYLYYLTGNERYHILYKNENPEFFNKEKKIKRKKFAKTGSRTILLGGKLSNKAIIRVISETAFIAWKEALEAEEEWKKEGFDYIPVEPILKNKRGEYRAKKFKYTRNHLIKPKWWPTGFELGYKEEGIYYRVITKVLGPSLGRFIQFSNDRTINSELESNAEKIRLILKKMRIYHGHTHEHNFCIEYYNNKPRVYVIDFDQSKSKKEKYKI